MKHLTSLCVVARVVGRPCAAAFGSVSRAPSTRPHQDQPYIRAGVGTSPPPAPPLAPAAGLREGGVTNTSDGHNNWVLLHISTCRNFFTTHEKYFEGVRSTFFTPFIRVLRVKSRGQFEVPAPTCLQHELLPLTEEARVNTVVSCFYDLAPLTVTCAFCQSGKTTPRRKRNKMMEYEHDLFLRGKWVR